MISREFLISLGITLLLIVGVFIYFRKRLAVVEHKLNMMFQLIEEHNQQQSIRFQPAVSNPIMPTNFRVSAPAAPKEELITVSDGEESDSGSSDSDSDESSSDDESEQINISSEDKVDTIELGDVKHINLSFNSGHKNDGLDDLESLGESDKEIQTIDLNENEKKMEHEENTQYTNLIEKITTNLTNEVEEVASQMNLKNLRVPELKAMAKEKGIKTKGLRKDDLIAALNEN